MKCTISYPKGLFFLSYIPLAYRFFQKKKKKNSFFAVNVERICIQVGKETAKKKYAKLGTVNRPNIENEKINQKE